MDIDDQPDPTPPCRVALNTVARVRQEMCRVYRRSRTGLVTLADATRQIYILDKIARLIIEQDVEERLEKLEALAGQLPAGGVTYEHH